jgi:tetratricopeptide (TPR) repeat protein
VASCEEHDKQVLYGKLFEDIKARDFDNARAWLSAEVKREGVCANEVQRLLVDADYYDLKLRADVTEEEWAKVAVKYNQLLKEDRFRSDEVIYLRMAEITNELGRYEDVFDWCREGLKVKKESRFYSLLVIASYHLNRFEAADQFYGAAYNLEPGVVAHTDMMTALSKSYAERGLFDLAKKTLLLLSEKNPKAVNRAEFKEAFEFVLNKLEEAGLE